MVNDDVAEEELPHNTDTCVEFDPDCGECVKQRLEADTATVPISVVEVHTEDSICQTCVLHLNQTKSCVTL